MYSAVNKAGKTVVEAGAKIKKTVEENVSNFFTYLLLSFISFFIADEYYSPLLQLLCENCWPEIRAGATFIATLSRLEGEQKGGSVSGKYRGTR